MIHRGFIGLSAPVAYDFKHGGPRLSSHRHEVGNPILEGGVSLSLMYDELWFLTRALCPLNLRERKWVHFLDEEGLLPDISDLSIYALNTMRHQEPGWRNWNDKTVSDSRRPSSFFLQQQSPYIPWRKSTLAGLMIGDHLWAACFDITRVLFDSLVLARVIEGGNLDMEIIGNSYNHDLMASTHSFARTRAVTSLLFSDLPEHLAPEGPFHPVLEELRSDRLISEFRQWITAAQPPPDQVDNEMWAARIRNGIRKAANSLFVRAARDSAWRRVGMAAALDAIGILVPGLSTAVESGRIVVSRKNRNKLHWQAFLVSAEEKMQELDD